MRLGVGVEVEVSVLGWTCVSFLIPPRATGLGGTLAAAEEAEPPERRWPPVLLPLPQALPPALRALRSGDVEERLPLSLSFVLLTEIQPSSSPSACARHVRVWCVRVCAGVCGCVRVCTGMCAGCTGYVGVCKGV